MPLFCTLVIKGPSNFYAKHGIYQSRLWFIWSFIQYENCYFSSMGFHQLHMICEKDADTFFDILYYLPIFMLAANGYLQAVIPSFHYNVNLHAKALHLCTILIALTSNLFSTTRNRSITHRKAVFICLSKIRIHHLLLSVIFIQN